MVDLPWPPSLNRLWRYRRGRVYRSKAYVNWIAQADSLWMALKPKGISYPRVPGKFRAKIILAPPDGKRRGDADNFLKAAFDWLQHIGIIENDKFLERFCVCYEDNKSAPHGVRIELKVLDKEN